MNNNFDIAIIGMSCRFPGANDLDSFWNNLANGVESISHFSDEELKQSGIPDSLLTNPNYVKATPVIDEPGMFDASFFGFTPMEAKTMDPQHRILLECAYQALEHSGYNADNFDGRIGVYTGSAMNTYFMNNIFRSKFVDEYIPTLIGNDKDFLSTRISYKLNLKGPSINVQTACSTSLVAIHLACQSLISEESDLVLAGAVSVKAPHKAGYICDGGGIVSSDAHVRAFDVKANGTVFGSGCGVVVLKRLSDAIKDNDTIHAVIKASAVNNDGSEKAGYTAPSVNSQADVVIEALSLADIEADSITYIEAHGSGTPLGDPIELAALTKAFRNFTDNKQFCAVGSVKTNIGHLDVAAGMAGLIKSVLSLKNKKIPPSINYTEPNPEIDFKNGPFFVSNQLVDWKSSGLRRAGIMSTGIGGTNAYLILEEAPETKSLESDLPVLLTLSAKTEEALDQSSKKLAEFFERNESVNIKDVAYTLQRGRKTFNHRKFLVCKSKKQAIEILQQENSKQIYSGKLQNNSKRPIIFLFPGIGDHYLGMGYDLYQNVKEFKYEVDHCAEILKNYIDVDIRELIYPKGFKRKDSENSSGIDLKKMLASRVNKSADENIKKINQTLYAQPALFTIEYALAKLWMHLGVIPDAIVGHSMGEYVAACLSGVFSLEDSLKLIAIRAKLVNKLPQGGMLAVTLSETELMPLLREGLSISLINSPNLCVVAGDKERVNQFEEVLKNKEILYRQVQNAHAFHSKMLDPIFDAYVEEVKKIKLTSPKIPFTSNLTGNWVSEKEVTDPVYWANHAIRTARFSSSLEKAWQINNNILLEVGPGTTLSVLTMQHPESKINKNPVTISSLRPEYDNQSDISYVLNGVGKLWLSGIEIDWEQLYQDEKPKRIPLPTYPFQKENYWIESKPVEVEEASQKSEEKVQRNEFKDWFYVPSWKRSTMVFENNTNFVKLKDTNWLIFSSDSELEKKSIEKLNELNCNILLVKKGKSFSVQDENRLEINHHSEDDYIKLFKELNRKDFHPYNILHFWNYSFSTQLTLSHQKLSESLYNNLYSLFFIAKNLQANGSTESILLGIITGNLHNVLGNEKLVSPETAIILGPASVINKEIENVFCKCIDFSDSTNTLNEQTSQLLSEFDQQDRNEIIAYRNKFRWLQSLERIDLITDKRMDYSRRDKIKPGGVYLITGGTGGLGLVFAEHFAKSENVKLVLTKKSEFPNRSLWQNWITENHSDNKTSYIINKLLIIEQLGSTVDVEVCDISDEYETKSLIEKIINRHGKIDGVIHAAGKYEDKLIFQKDVKSINNLISPKIFGTLNLYNNLKIDDLDFFILFSSVSSIIPPSGQFDYSAANIYMDAFANYINEVEFSNLSSINWYAWKEVGILPELRVRTDMRKWKEDLLQKAISNSDGVKAIGLILQNLPSQIIVSPEQLNHKNFKKFSFENIKRKMESKVEINDSQSGLPDKIQNTILSSIEDVENKLTFIWQEILGVDKIKKSNNFFELGGHSLLVIQLLSSIRKSFNIDLDFEIFFDTPTLDEMSNKIFEKIDNH